ncbi:MAG: hypothetical protein AAFX80_00230 [Cyanobacteria bacterium J06639_18]
MSEEKVSALENIKKCLNEINENNSRVFECLNRTDFQVFVLIQKHLQLVHDWGSQLESILEQGGVDLDIFARAKILVSHCISLNRLKPAEKFAVVISISAECQFLWMALESKEKQELIRIDLSVEDAIESDSSSFQEVIIKLQEISYSLTLFQIKIRMFSKF